MKKEDLSNDLIYNLTNFKQKNWDVCIRNIIYGRPFFLDLPEKDTDPILQMLSLWGVVLKSKIDTTYFKNSLKMLYLEIPKTAENVNQLEIIISMAPAVGVDLFREFEKDYNKKVFKNIKVSAGTSLQNILLLSMGKMAQSPIVSV